MAIPLRDGMTAESVFAALAMAGFWPVVLKAPGEVIHFKGGNKTATGKEPVGLAWGKKRLTAGEMVAEFRKVEGRGVGIATGPGRGPDGSAVADIEVDGPEGLESLSKLLGDAPPETLGWKSRRGPHRLYRYDYDRVTSILGADHPVSVKDEALFPGLEIRVGSPKQSQSCVPPTETGGVRREWDGPHHISWVNEAFYESLARITPDATAPEPDDGEPDRPTDGWDEAKNDAWQRDADPDRAKAYFDKVLKSRCRDVALSRPGNSNNTLRNAAVTLGGYLWTDYLEPDECRAALTEAARERKIPEAEIDDLIIRGFIYGQDHKLPWPESLRQKVDPDGQARTGNGKPEDEKPTLDDYLAAPDDELGILHARDVVPENPVWLWLGRVLVGKINLLAGDGGDGKSQIATLIASIVTRGGVFPDGHPAGEAGTVMVVAAEDGAADTLKPRFIATGADPERLIFLTAKVKLKARNGRPAMVNPMSLQDLDYWRALFMRHRPRMLIVDPMPPYLGPNVNDHKNNEVQRVLDDFAPLLDEFLVALMGITQFTKASDQKLQHRIMASVAYVNTARLVNVTLKDPNDPAVRYFARPKCNLDQERDPMIYRVVPFEFDHDGKTIQTSRVEFEPEPVAVDVEALARQGGKKSPEEKPAGSKVTTVAEWLFDRLSDTPGPERVASILEAAGEKGMVGKLRDDNKWSGRSTLWDAADLIPKLEPPRAGFRIQALKLKGEGPRKVTWWQLVGTDQRPRRRRGRLQGRARRRRFGRVG